MTALYRDNGALKRHVGGANHETHGLAHKKARLGAEEGLLGSGSVPASAHLGCTGVRVGRLLVAIPNYARVTGAKAFAEAEALPDSITFLHYGAFLCG
jgi:hypothetical protein